MATWAQYREGQHKFQCERCGRSYWSKDKRIDGYTGGIVCPECFDPKHPQDYVRAHPDDPSVENARPRVTQDISVDAPTLVSATVSPNGRSVALVFSKPVTTTGSDGFSMEEDAVPVTLGSLTGKSVDWTLDLIDVISGGATVTISYDADDGDVEDYGLNPLADITDQSVTNGSTVSTETASVAATVGAATASLAALNVPTSAGVVASVASVTASLTARYLRSASAAATVGEVVASAAATAIRKASVTATAAATTASGMILGGTRTASAAATVASVTASAAAWTTTRSATVSAEVGAVTATGAAILTRHVAVTAQVGSVTASAAAAAVRQATVNATTGAVTAAAVATPGQLLVQDTFTDTNGTELVSHVPDVDVVGTGWVTVAGIDDNITIQSNKATSDLSGLQNAWIDAGEQNKEVKATVNASTVIGAAGNARLYANYDGGTNQLYCDFDADASATIRIREVVGGSTVDRASSAHTFNTDTDYVVKITRAGANVSVDWDGGAVTLNYGSVNAAITSTLAGFRLNEDITFDNFEVRG